MKATILLFFLLYCGFVSLFAQQQVKMPWPSLADSPWPVLRGDMQGTGRSEYIGPRTNNVIWRKDMPLGILYGPIIGYDNKLYMGERAVSPDSVNYFYALTKDGQIFWTFNTQGGLPNNSGAVQTKDSTIYFFSRNKQMYALNADGSLKWAYNIYANFRSFQPIAKNGDIYIPYPDTLFILNSSGELKRRVNIPLISEAISFSPGGDTLYFITGRIMTGEPGALNAADLDGNILWKYDLGIVSWGIPLIDNQNKIYIYGQDSLFGNAYLYSFNPSGTLNWKYVSNTLYSHLAPTMDRNGNIILFSHKLIDSLYVAHIVSLNYNGNENWSYKFDGDRDNHLIDHGLVCDAEGKIYCGSSHGGYFYCINNNGELLWKLDIGDYEYDSCPAIDSDGTLYIGLHKSSTFPFHIQNLIAVKDSPTSVSDYYVLNEYNLEQNYPNPFNPNTTIKYEIKNSGLVKLNVYNILGSKVAELVNEFKAVGYYSVEFNASNLPSGVYIYELQSSDFISSKKMILLK
jgi:hypothetical protein